MYGTYIPKQKFDSIRILVLYDVTKIWKNHPFVHSEKCQKSTTIWGLQNMNSAYQLLYIVEILFQTYEGNNINSLS